MRLCLCVCVCVCVCGGGGLCMFKEKDNTRYIFENLFSVTLNYLLLNWNNYEECKSYYCKSLFIL